MPNICIPCASVERLLDSGVFALTDPNRAGPTECPPSPSLSNPVVSLHNQDLKFFCST